jgi:hypothetical protein
MPVIDYLTHLFFTDRIRMQMLTERGKILKALCQYETLVDGDWVPVVRYDTAHGVFHKDILSLDGTKRKEEVDYVDLKSAVRDARRDLIENWESYKYRFFSKKRR